MNRKNVELILVEPLFLNRPRSYHVSTTLEDQFQWWGVVVFEGVLYEVTLELVLAIFPLGAQIIHLVVGGMPCVQETLYLVQGIPIHSFDVGTRKPHCNDVIGDVGEVEIIVCPYKPFLVFGNYVLDGIAKQGLGFRLFGW